MFRLIPYELGKIWRKRSFQSFSLILLLLNLFLLWYWNKPGEDTPPLSAYHAICADVSGMREEEKLTYIANLKERISGVALINEVMNLQSLGDELGQTLAEQMRVENPDVFEKYMDDYLDGGYLTYTDSLYQEKTLLDALYDEVEKVSGYDQYLASVQQSKEDLSGISIFAGAENDSYSSRNLIKSAEDHAGRSSAGIRWFPAKGFLMATETSMTDLLLLLSVFLFVGGLITEEKEKGLFFFTRATKKGIASCIAAKLASLWIHCLAISALLCASNFVYAYRTAGLGDLTAALQSIAPFLESSLSISLLDYAVLGILTKAMVLFCLGTALTLISICSAKSFLPQLAGVGWLAANWLAYTLIPAYSALSPLKYLSFFGLMKPKHLYGEYLNFNIAGYPVPRLTMALSLIGTICALGIGLAFLLFKKGKSLEIRKAHISSFLPFRPHGRFLVHEGYKILFTSKAILVFLLFAVLIGAVDLGKEYSPSVHEQYYRNMMLTLEGELTTEKETMIAAEQARYDEAFAQLDRIDAMVASGELDKNAGEDLKTRWYGVLTFYPSFQRVLQQYQHVRQDGGVFIYDTGYRYLFGTMDHSYLIDFLLLSLCMVFAFGNIIAMEYQKQSWYLLSATAKGKRKILQKKLLVCALCAAGIALLPWIFRMISISSVYPLHEWCRSIQSIPMYFTFGVGLPIWAFLILACLSQICAVALAGAIVLFFSWQRRNYLQTLFLALLILVVPLVLTVMGIDFAKWFSLYPFYGWVSRL